MRTWLRDVAERYLRPHERLYTAIFRTAARMRTVTEVRSFWQSFGTDVERFSHDAVLSHDVFAAPLCTSIERRFGAARIVDVVDHPDLGVRTGDSYRDRPQYYRNRVDRENRRFIEGAALLLTTSPGHSQWLRDEMNCESVVLPNMRNRFEIDDDEVIDLRAKFGLPPGTKLIVLHNQISKIGGAELALSALTLLPETFHLVFLGPFSPAGLRSELAVAEQELDLGGRVHWHEPLWSTDLIRALRGCDIGLILFRPGVPNVDLGMPNRVYDLLAAGVPTVATRLPMVGSLIEELGYGVIADAAPESVAQAVRATDEKWQQLRQSALLAAKDHCWEMNAASTIDAIQSTTGAKRIVIVARKNHYRNNRIKRQIGMFTEAGIAAKVIDFDGKAYRLT